MPGADQARNLKLYDLVMILVRPYCITNPYLPKFRLWIRGRVVKALSLRSKGPEFDPPQEAFGCENYILLLFP